jgi:hypothetical protein
MEEGASTLRLTTFSATGGAEVQGRDPRLDGRDRPVAVDAHEDEPTHTHAALLHGDRRGSGVPWSGRR